MAITQMSPLGQGVTHGDYVRNNCQLLQPTVPYAMSTFVKSKFQAFLSAVISSCDPVSSQEAVQDPKWCTAMNLELRALEENGTWCITDLYPGRKAIRWKWIFKTKYHSDGSIDKHKARLVIQDCRQKAGIDYIETFAPVAKMTTVRALLAVAAIKG